MKNGRINLFAVLVYYEEFLKQALRINLEISFILAKRNILLTYTNQSERNEPLKNYGLPKHKIQKWTKAIKPLKSLVSGCFRKKVDLICNLKIAEVNENKMHSNNNHICFWLILPVITIFVSGKKRTMNRVFWIKRLIKHYQSEYYPIS